MPPRVLLLSERRPDPNALGGTELVVHDLLAHAPEELFAAHRSGRRLVVEAWRAGRRRELAALDLAPYGDDPLERPGLADALESAIWGTGCQLLHVHSPGLGPRAILRAVEATGVRCVVTLHDQVLACENPHLLERGERYCGLPQDLRRCDSCLAATLGRGPGRLETWRESMAALVGRADAIVAPSASVGRLVTQIYPEAARKLKRIDWGVRKSAKLPVEGAPGPLRIAIVGVVADIKGASRLPELLVACRDLDVEWHLFGAREGRSVRAIQRAAPGLVVHGAYRRNELAARLRRARCELALLPSIAPEAFGLVLSELAAAGCPALVSDLGALPERVAALGAGFTFDPWNAAELSRRVAELARDRRLLVQAAQTLRRAPPWTPEDMARAHAAVWQALGVPDQGAPLDEARRAAARRRFERERRRSGPLLAAVRALRSTSFYRDLGVRGWLSEDLRRRCERAANLALDRLLDWRRSR